MHLNQERLRQKGWSEREIKHAHTILKQAERKTHAHHHLLGEAVFWGVLFLAVLGTVAVSGVWLIPLLTLNTPSVLFPIIIIVGIAFGLLFSVVIKDLDHLTTKHHAIIMITVPITGIISFFTITTMLGGHRGPGILIGLAYTVAFLSPYLFHTMTKG